MLTAPSLYIAALLQALRAMLQMELPHVNVLTKIDNLASQPRLPFELAFYTDVQDLEYLLPQLEAESATGRMAAKFAALNEAVIGLVEDFALVSFETLVVEDKRSMMTLLHAVDRAGGYAFGSADGANDSVWQVAMREGFRGLEARDVQERWIDRRDELDEKERLEAEARIQSEQEPDIVDGSTDAAAPGHGAQDASPAQKLPDSGIKVVRKK